MRGQAGAGVEQVESPAKFGSKAGDGLGVVAGAAEEEVNRRSEVFEEGGGGVVLDPARGGVGEGDVAFALPEVGVDGVGGEEFALVGAGEVVSEHCGALRVGDGAERGQRGGARVGGDTFSEQREETVAAGGGAPCVILGSGFEEKKSPADPYESDPMPGARRWVQGSRR